jgi:hypothetical protein
LSSRMKRCPVFSGVLGHRRWWFPDRGTKGTIGKFHSNKHWLKIVLWKAKGGSSHQMDRCLNMFEQGKVWEVKMVNLHTGRELWGNVTEFLRGAEYGMARWEAQSWCCHG